MLCIPMKYETVCVCVCVGGGGMSRWTAFNLYSGGNRINYLPRKLQFKDSYFSRNVVKIDE
jgi:hypothetical protein